MSGLRAALRKAAPIGLRRVYAQSRRIIADRVSGLHHTIVRDGPAPDPVAPTQATLTQTIFETPTSHGKIVNLERAAGLVSVVSIPPGGIFSFWALVGRPTASRGFAMGRTIVADEVSEDVGGGLCQMSGLIYELGLRAGLSVVERHAHSRDLYTEATRFAPLGLDATVAYAFKDLRLRNTLVAPVAFAFRIETDRIEACLRCAAPVVPCALDIAVTTTADRRTARVVRRGADGAEALISDDVYAVGA